MILRESGMPEQNQWEQYFNPTEILEIFKLIDSKYPIADIGCGYGTFTIPLAKQNKINIYAIDINSEYLSNLENISLKYNLPNIITVNEDVFENELHLPEKAGNILLFNILHCDNPNIIIHNILPSLLENGVLNVIHWRSDIETPRGPSLEIRPKQNDIIKMMEPFDFKQVDYFPEISKYHYGISFQRSIDK